MTEDWSASERLARDPGDETKERSVGDAVLDAILLRPEQPGDDELLRPATMLKDSGQDEHFPGGSWRDSAVGKGRYDLIPPGPLFRLARIYEDGAIKRGEDNWRLGQPIRRYIESAIRHLEKVKAGLKDEDHLAQAAWNCFGAMWTEAAIAEGLLPEELGKLHKEPENPYGTGFAPWRAG